LATNRPELVNRAESVLESCISLRAATEIRLFSFPPLQAS
jgi:hypothetical protein